MIENQNTPLVHEPIPSAFVDGEEILFNPDKEAFKAADDAAEWLRFAARNLSGVSSEYGIDGEYNQGCRGSVGDPYKDTYALTVWDDLGNQYSIDGIKDFKRNGDELFNTSIAFTTNPGTALEYTTKVFRDSNRKINKDGSASDSVVYSAGKYVDDKLDGDYNPQLVRTQPGELTQVEASAVEKSYITLANNFKYALESKLARVYPDGIHRINRDAIEFKVKKAEEFMQKSGLLSRLFGLQ